MGFNLCPVSVFAMRSCRTYDTGSIDIHGVDRGTPFLNTNLPGWHLDPARPTEEGALTSGCPVGKPNLWSSTIDPHFIFTCMEMGMGPGGLFLMLFLN